MPILFNFHILLATFYTIFGTNILIQCLVPVPVCCMFYVSQKNHIKRNPNGIKTDGELFWNIWDFPEEESTRNGARGGQEIGAHAHLKWARPPPSWATRKAAVSVKTGGPWVGGVPPTSWLPRFFPDVHSKSTRLLSFQK